MLSNFLSTLLLCILTIPVAYLLGLLYQLADIWIRKPDIKIIYYDFVNNFILGALFIVVFFLIYISSVITLLALS